MTTKSCKEDNPKFRRLFWDIEVTPNIGLYWRPGFQVDVNYDGIIKERKIICIGYSWEGEKKAHVLRWDSNQDDRQMLKEFLEIANQADELVAHYGDMFDVKWFRTRCLILGFDPIPAWKTVDTKAWASKYYYFNSNKLDYLSKVLGYGGKLKTDFDLWKDILLKNCKKALNKMCTYCAVDVLKLKKVFYRLEGCVKPKTHAGVFAGEEKWTSPFNGSRNVEKSKTCVTANGTIQHRMLCRDSRKYYIITQTAYEAFCVAKARNQRG